ncbi:MAG: hypothetical protein LBS60_12635 [Deltaproteobacteria bacterium]|nr:hypothetical protein [Deltaproteobacteria bacterium]
MREIYCVKCQTKLLVKDSSAILRGGWINCPACHEIFQPQLLDASEIASHKWKRPTPGLGHHQPGRAPKRNDFNLAK